MDEADGGGDGDGGDEADGGGDGDGTDTRTDEDRVRTRDGGGDDTPSVTAEYYETGTERVLAFDRDGRTAAVVQNRDGYAMLKVRTSAAGDELERYYGFEMALDHAAERLGVRPDRLPVPEDATDMGM